MKKLELRHEKFCHEYVKDLNGQRAAEAAGFKKESARARASQLLTKQNIQNRIARLQEDRCRAADISAERVLREIALLGFSNMDDYVDIVGDKRVLNTAKPTRDQMAAVQEITEDTTGGDGDGERKLVLRTRFKLVSKVESLKLLGQHLKLFTEVVKHEGLEGLAQKTAALRARKRAV